MGRCRDSGSPGRAGYAVNRLLGLRLTRTLPCACRLAPGTVTGAAVSVTAACSQRCCNAEIFQKGVSSRRSGVGGRARRADKDTLRQGDQPGQTCLSGGLILPRLNPQAPQALGFAAACMAPVHWDYGKAAANWVGCCGQDWEPKGFYGLGGISLRSVKVCCREILWHGYLRPFRSEDRALTNSFIVSSVSLGCL